jgi:SAM-dependent methyltransferase
MAGEVAGCRACGVYDEAYYASQCGPVPYGRNERWLGYFGAVADNLLRSFAPRRVFDAGCAFGLLVESFWDRGVEAHGRDVSDFAISQVRKGMQGFCRVGSIADPIEGGYDLVTCIEVLEHLPEAEALQAIASMARAAPRLLFSSSPGELTEPTRVNVRPVSYWLARFAEAGFAPLVSYDAGFVAPHAFVLERAEAGRSPAELAAFAEKLRLRVDLAVLGRRLPGLQAELAQVRERLRSVEAQAQRRADEERRVRTASAERAAGTRREAIEALSQLARARQEIAALREQSQHELAEARDQARREQAAALDQAQLELAQAREQVRLITRDRDAVVQSTAWRATWPLRRLVALVPAAARRRLRQALRLAWWSVTLQLGSRLRGRRAPAATGVCGPDDGRS